MFSLFLEFQIVGGSWILPTAANPDHLFPELDLSLKQTYTRVFQHGNDFSFSRGTLVSASLPDRCIPCMAEHYTNISSRRLDQNQLDTYKSRSRLETEMHICADTGGFVRRRDFVLADSQTTMPVYPGLYAASPTGPHCVCLDKGCVCTTCAGLACFSGSWCRVLRRIEIRDLRTG